jgi:site-specific recombinase XerD
MADANAAALRLSDAVERYVTDRAERGEIGASSARQLRWRLGTLARCWPELEVVDLAPEHVKEWQRTIGWQKPASRRAYLSTLKTFCRWLIEEDYLERDPTLRTARVREPRVVPRALSDAQLARLRAVLPDLEARLMILLMARLGLRCIEVANLRLEHYDTERQTVLVAGKGDNERLLPVPSDVARPLCAFVADRTAGPVFIDANAATVSRRCSQWFDAAGLKATIRDGMSAHALRHTAASNLLERCGDVRLVQAFLGHQSLVTTDRYLRQANVEQMRAALAPPSSEALTLWSEG